MKEKNELISKLILKISSICIFLILFQSLWKYYLFFPIKEENVT